MSKKTKTAAPVVNFDAGAMYAKCQETVAGIVAHFETLALTDAKHGATAKQWANEGRVTLSPSLFTDAQTLVESGMIDAPTIERALVALVDVDGKRAPVYGVVKCASIIRTLACGMKSPTMSDLHRACILALSGDWADNATIHQRIARECVVSATGTAPTQRSSSAYALRVLGMIEERNEGRVGMMRFVDSDATRTLSRIVGESSPLTIKGGAY